MLVARAARPQDHHRDHCQGLGRARRQGPGRHQGPGRRQDRARLLGQGLQLDQDQHHGLLLLAMINKQ